MSERHRLPQVLQQQKFNDMTAYARLSIMLKRPGRKGDESSRLET